jgi:hypothetical protein
MAFQLSPGINVSEIDLTNAVPAVGTSEGAFVGTFRWGPVNERILVSSEVELVARFGKPKVTSAWNNSQSFYTAANFLGYSSALYVTRADNGATAANGETFFKAKYPGILGNSIKVIACEGDATDGGVNNAFYDANGAPGGSSETNRSTLSLTRGQTTAIVKGEVPAAATAIAIDGTATGASLEVNTGDTVSNGVPANSIALGTPHTHVTGQAVVYNNGSNPVSETGSIGGLTNGQTYYLVVTGDFAELASSYNNAVASVPTTINLTGDNSNFGATTTFTVQESTTTVENYFSVGDIIGISGESYIVETVSGYNSATNTVNLTFTRKYWGETTTDATYDVSWEGSIYFESAPLNGRFHIAVIDEDGEITGTKGALLEAFSDVSETDGDKYFDGRSAFYEDVLETSQYFTRKNPELAASKLDNIANGKTSEQLGADIVDQTPGVNLGTDGYTETADEAVSGILLGWDLYKNPDEVDVSLLLTGWAKADVANYVFDNIAETRKDCVAFASAQLSDTTAQDIVDYAADLSGSSYSVMDQGYKYQYDKYNDKYVWVPMNADVAGTCARTDGERDPWFSPAGYSRGQIKNVVKLNLNPNKTQRDLLYKNNINPIIIEPGSGAILFGDKTMQRNPSAFDRINVRRLFIVLEKAIALASKSTLFEFNDEFTRATFRNMIEPFLRDVQGRRGIYDFKVVCDQTNNTGEVIDTNRFIGDIYIKPARSINFIQLNFVAVRTGVDFNEIIGQ